MIKRSLKIALLTCLLGVAAVGAAGCQKENVQNPQATIEMEDGQLIVIELLPEHAPNSVANFIELAQSGFYDGVVFHRIIPGFMIQGGDPTGTGMGGPDYSIKGEFSSNNFKNTLLHERGVLSMARSANNDSAGSQFFLMVADAPHLNDNYAAFGRVISGMEVVDEIVAGPRTGPSNDLAARPQAMKTVTIDTFGKEWPAPEKTAK